MAKKSMRIKGGKRGQVALFVIIGIVIISAILIFFFWVRPTYLSEGGRISGFESCVQDATETAVDELALKGGFANPEFVYSYESQEIPYLCYTEAYYETCTVQVPFLKQNFEEQMENVLREKINVCYDNSINSLKSQGYDVVSGNVEYNVLAEPGVVRIEIDAPTSVGTNRFTRFNVEINSPVYEEIMIATSVLQYETAYGDTDTSSMNALYPEFYIDKMKRSDGTTVYAIESKGYETKFQFASRSLAWPAGYV